MVVEWEVKEWRSKENLQRLPFNLDQEKYIYDTIISKLCCFPALVPYDEISDLIGVLQGIFCQNDRKESSTHQSHASQPKFILQGGYCAESFADAVPLTIQAVIDTLKQIGNGITDHDLGKLVMLPRIAGQYGKPRSQLSELNAKLEPICSYRGDIIHSFSQSDRRPDPDRITMAYDHAKRTIEYIKSKHESGALKYGRNLFLSHEAFCLPYEEGLARHVDPDIHPGAAMYGSSAHFLWLGERTTSIGHAHIEFLKHIRNPIGIKLGPNKCTSSGLQDLTRMLDVLNPHKAIGRITLITRLGASNVDRCLPLLVDKVAECRHPVLWICDPMHGNTVTVKVPLKKDTSECEDAALLDRVESCRPFSPDANASHAYVKTRSFDCILKECVDTLKMHRKLGSRCSGLHLEFSEDPLVTECTGGITAPVTLDQLHDRYTSKCDPRLNRVQLLDLMRELKPYIFSL